MPQSTFIMREDFLSGHFKEEVFSGEKQTLSDADKKKLSLKEALFFSYASFEKEKLLEAEETLEACLFSIKANEIKNSKEFLMYCDAIYLLLTIYAEREKNDKLKELEFFLEEIRPTFLERNRDSFFHLFLGITISYQKKDMKRALELLQIALELVFKEKSKNNEKILCYISLTLACVYKEFGELEKSLQELNNLSVLFQFLPFFEIKIQAHLLKARVLRRQQKPREAISVLEEVAPLIKKQKNYYYLALFLYQMASAHKDMEEFKKAYHYFETLDYFIDEKNCPSTFKKIQKKAEILNKYCDDKPHLILNLSEHKAYEKRIGEVDFKNQFILFSLLKLLVLNRDKKFSKRDLARHLWSEEYRPQVHDNKVYVTVRRLREIIEPDKEQFLYVLHTRKGYYLSPAVKIFIQENENRAKYLDF